MLGTALKSQINQVSVLMENYFHQDLPMVNQISQLSNSAAGLGRTNY